MDNRALEIKKGAEWTKNGISKQNSPACKEPENMTKAEYNLLSDALGDA